jgi:hypothetical protein
VRTGAGHPPYVGFHLGGGSQRESGHGLAGDHFQRQGGSLLPHHPFGDGSTDHFISKLGQE